MGKRIFFNCIHCANKVTSRQHAVQCDGCGEWQHRKCNTGKEHFITKTHGPCNTQIRAYEKSQHVDDFGRIKIICFIKFNQQGVTQVCA